MAWILLTGATGFLGRTLLAQAQAREIGVLALVRRPEQAPIEERPGLLIQPGDLADPASLDTAAARLAGLDPDGWVVHAGALISYRSADRRASFEVNQNGTANLLAALDRARLRRLLLVSSVVTSGPARSLAEPADETAPVASAGLRSAYLHSKRAAEDLVWAWGREPGRDARAILPGAIFGPPGRKANTSRFLRRVLERGAPLWVPPGSLSPVGVEDVGEGLWATLERGRPGQRYLLVEHAASLVGLFETAARAAGRRPPRGALSAGAWRRWVALMRAVDAVRPLDLLAPDGLELLGQHFAYRADKARRELGWCPRPFSELLPKLLHDLSRTRG